MTTDDSTMGRALQREASSPDWREALGPFWKVQFAGIALLLFIAGAFRPFSDPDLAIHLATGEWIAKHRAVPFVEPFAWTRAGAPFQAYSWLIEVGYFELISHFGPSGLAALQGSVYVLLAAVMVVLGRNAGWNAWVIIAMALGNLIVALAGTPNVRPASILLIAIPLVWALVYRALRTNNIAPTLVGLVAVSALLANTHLLFPLAGAPCALLLTQRPANPRRILMVPLALILGWFLSPYALNWPDVFALNFAPNALFGPPSPINEYKPGFLVTLTGGNSSYLVALLLTFLPWLVAHRLDLRSRLLFGLLWLAGLLMFALAVRSLLVWWLVSLPLCALALDQLQSSQLPVVRTAQRCAVLAVFGIIALLPFDTWFDPAFRAGTVASRFLPASAATAIEPIAKWLDCFTRHDAGGRLVTEFNYGGYITWRLPFLSESIDGRTIFPDSVARAETYFFPSARDVPLPPWRSADLAIFPMSFPVAAVLDTAAGWHRVAITSQVRGPARMIALWVTDRWWQHAGTIPMPRTVTPLMHSLEPRLATCHDVTPFST